MNPHREPVTPEAVVSVALDLLADGGLDAVSFRRIATELGVSAPTLYWHVESKRQLMDLMAEELMHRTGAVPRVPEPDEMWWGWLRAHASRMFDALVATRDAPRILAGNRPTQQSFPHLEQVLQVLVDAGLRPIDAQLTLFAIGSYVIGSATEWQAEAEREQAQPLPLADDDEAKAMRAKALADQPLLLAAIDDLLRLPNRAGFEHGLDLIIDGARARYAV